MEDIITTIDKQHVEKGVLDWKKRVSELYSTINSWLADSEFSLRYGSKLPMYEGLMWQFNVQATEIDTVAIYSGKTFVLVIKPKGLWVIGVNGLIEILTTKGNYLLKDCAEQFAPPQWKLFYGLKNKEVDFNKEIFFQILMK